MKLYSGYEQESGEVVHYEADFTEGWLEFSANCKVRLRDLRFLIHDPYRITAPEGGFRALESFDAAELARYRPYALLLACLDSNAFPDLIDQYVPEAYEVLRANGWLDTLPAGE